MIVVEVVARKVVVVVIVFIKKRCTIHLYVMSQYKSHADEKRLIFDP